MRLGLCWAWTEALGDCLSVTETRVAVLVNVARLVCSPNIRGPSPPLSPTETGVVGIGSAWRVKEQERMLKECGLPLDNQ